METREYFYIFVSFPGPHTAARNTKSIKIITEEVCGDKCEGKDPHFRIIGWDFSVDELGDPVLIEYNGAPGMNQISRGPLFGDLTEPALNTIFLHADELRNI
ncbi:hypothetical protein QBE55_00540 [Eubacteriales bacterium mix99]